MDLAFTWETLLSLSRGIPLTLKLASMSIAVGAILALLLALIVVWRAVCSVCCPTAVELRARNGDRS